MKNLSAARTYFAVHGTLAAPKDAVADGVAVGQWPANLRKTGGLGTNQERATERRRLLEALDAGWNPAWPVDWQRRYILLRRLVEDDSATPGERGVLGPVLAAQCDLERPGRPRWHRPLARLGHRMIRRWRRIGHPFG
ncbi:helicase associated domain-containing protein [Streptomyces sp. NPDC059788]|uniref:helicase associated domain-containing protein n=1 Tax=Streptomyces sp. NPDC059788 TaxID=3346948 RepID=UPI003647A235